MDNNIIKKTVFLFTVLVLSSCTTLFHKSSDGYKLKKNEFAVLGYGSLINKTSLEQTLGHSYENPFIPVFLNGYKRVWNVCMPNEGAKKYYYTDTNGKEVMPKQILYLNIDKTSSPDDKMIATVFVVTKTELAALDKRESVYDRVDIRTAIDQQAFAKLVPIYAYIAKPQFVIEDNTHTDLIVRQSYLDILNQGLENWGEEFRKEFDRSSSPFDSTLVVKDYLH